MKKKKQEKITCFVSAAVATPPQYMLLEVDTAYDYGDTIPVYKIVEKIGGIGNFVELRGTRTQLKELLEGIIEIL